MVRSRIWVFATLIVLAAFGLVACDGAPMQSETVNAVMDEFDVHSLIENVDTVGEESGLEMTSFEEKSMQADIAGLSSNHQEDENGEFEFVGVAVQISTGEWMIDGIQVQVDSQSEIEGAISEGDQVKVHVYLTLEGNLVARDIELFHDDVPEDQDEEIKEIEFSGVVEAIAGDIWTIGGTEVRMTSQTEIESGIAIGDAVQVEAYQAADGTLVALEIEVDDDGDSEDSFDNDGDGDYHDEEDDEYDDDYDDDLDDDHDQNSDDHHEIDHDDDDDSED